MYERLLVAYNKEVQRRIELENKVMGHSTRPQITYPHPLVEASRSIPFIEILDTPQRLDFYMVDELEEERIRQGPYKMN